MYYFDINKVWSLGHLKKSAIISTNALSKTSEESYSFQIAGKCLINYVIDAAAPFVDEVIIVTDSEEKAQYYSKTINPKYQIVFNENSADSMSSFLDGLEAIHGEYVLVLSSNYPFVSKDLISLLLELCIGKAAAIPRFSDMFIDPYYAVYNTKELIAAIRANSSTAQFDMYDVLEKLRGIRYISSMVFEQLDPDFKSFFAVNTPIDLKKAEALLKPKPTKNRTKTNNTKKH